MIGRQERLSIGLHDIVAQKPGYVVSDMDGDKVMFSVEEGKYYNLGRQGGAIWDLIASPIAVSDVVAMLVREYDVDLRTCEAQALAFLDNLRREGMIEVVAN